MRVSDRLTRFLDEQRIAYEILPHRQVFTAQEVAAATYPAGSWPR